MERTRSTDGKSGEGVHGLTRTGQNGYVNDCVRQRGTKEETPWASKEARQAG